MPSNHRDDNTIATTKNAAGTFDRGNVKDGRVIFPNWQSETEPPAGLPPAPIPVDQRIGFAVVGLGRLALEQILPAFSECKQAKLVALVSGTPDKRDAVAEQYGIHSDHVFGYDQFEQLSDLPDVEAVYIVVPNSLHREYIERSVAIRKPVLCEKPLATSVADAEVMVEACSGGKVPFMVAYRSQYERYNRFLTELVRSGSLGTVRAIYAANFQNMSAGDQWRLDPKVAGGGSIPDIGLYCLNGIRALLGEEPIEISALSHTPTDDPRFSQVEDVANFTMRFPSGVLATCQTGYSAHTYRSLQVFGSDAWARLDNAFAYRGQKLFVGRRSGMAEAIQEIQIPSQNQFSLEIDHLAECIRTGRTPRTGGDEALQDQRLMDAIYESIRTGAPVRFPVRTGIDSTRGPALPPLST